MPFGLPKFRLRMSVRKGVKGESGASFHEHRFEVAVTKVPGQTDEDRKAMISEISTELERQASAGDPEAARAALEAVAQRYGSTVERFEGH